MAASVVASLATLDGEEVATCIQDLVAALRTPEMPHEDSGVREQEKMDRLKTLNVLMNRLPAFKSAIERMYEAKPELKLVGRSDPKSHG